MRNKLHIGCIKINDGYCERLHFDAPLLSPRRVFFALLKFGWWSEIDRPLADKIGLWTFIKYEGRPYHQCMETGHFCG